MNKININEWVINIHTGKIGIVKLIKNDIVHYVTDEGAKEDKLNNLVWVDCHNSFICRQVSRTCKTLGIDDETDPNILNRYN